MIQAGSKIGMQSKDQHLLTLVSEGVLEKSEASKHADNPKLFLD